MNLVSDRIQKETKMTTRERNYHRKPHTASFLQAFHTGQTEAQRRTTAESFKETVTVSDETLAAKSFVTGRPVRDDGSRMVEINGYPVKVDGPNVSEKQAKWIIDIATTRITPEGRTAESVLIRLEQGFAKFAGSQFITSYKDLPRATAAMAEAVAPGASTEEFKARFNEAHDAAAKVDVPAGRYALRGDDDVVKFYRLDRPTQGQWAGFTFLKVQASDELHPIKNRTEKAWIIAEIGKDVLAAEQLYGRELGKCSRCGRTLTDETSRAYGIGPDCRSK